jgi:beta-aspartyl-peptidase (threonine type)
LLRLWRRRWCIIVHGGARLITPSKMQPFREGVLWALGQGVNVLKGGGSALDAVEQAVRAMEDSGTFNAGRGAAARRNGEVEMDASVMDGKSLDVGAVAAVRETGHPVSVARALLEEPPILLVGQYADIFARRKGFSAPAPAPRISAEAHDTVGCVAFDTAGNIATGMSTGGFSGSEAGRVGDVVLPGCGFYADNARGGLCMSGAGEKIARLTLAAEIMRGMDKMEAQEAAERALSRLKKRINGTGGCIAIDRKGRPAWAHTTPHFAVAFQSGGDKTPTVRLSKREK